MQDAGSALMGIGYGSGENRAVDAARAAIKAVIIDLYEQAIADGSINAEIKNVTLEAWSFNVAYVALIINLTRYDDADMELHDYYINTYFDRLEGV